MVGFIETRLFVYRCHDDAARVFPISALKRSSEYAGVVGGRDCRCRRLSWYFMCRLRRLGNDVDTMDDVDVNVNVRSSFCIGEVEGDDR